MFKYSLNALILILLLLFTSCTQDTTQNNAQSIDPEVTEQVLQHHWETFKAGDLEGVMEDYTEESFLITPGRTYSGLDEIRKNFVSAFETFSGDSVTLTLKKSVAKEDVGYIIWEATTPDMRLLYGTDTFVIRNGKIIRQTYGGVTEADVSELME